MSCPDWRDLTLRREASAGDGPEWRTALRHLDDCTACQAAAPGYDPTLLFRRLPDLEVGDDQVEVMKRAVASMRRGETIEHRRGPWLRSGLRAAALAAVALGSILLRGAASAPDGVSASVAPASVAPASVAPASAAPKAVASEINLRRMPLVETVDPAYSSIIQVVDDDISVVLVMPLKVDV